MRYLTEEFNEKFFAQPVDKVCEMYQAFINSYLGPNDIGTEHIRRLHNLGYLPLVFRAVPEGTRVPLRVPMLTVENTKEEFFWLTNYFETLMSCVLWLPSTSATTAMRTRAVLEEWCEITQGDPAFVDWQGHDFSFRGMEGVEAACLSGMGHLLAFTGTDTIPAIPFIRQYYGVGHTDPKLLPLDYIIGGSVPATEHSVMCAGGEATEQETYERLMKLYPGGILSVVSDTWDLWKILTVTIPNLKEAVLGRTGKLVIRPDSGDPVKIVCGDPDAPSTSPAAKGVMQLLWETFGGTRTKGGYKVLDPHIGVIYGDSINYDRAVAMCKGLAENKFATTNIVLGIGSYNYQHVTRDTYGFAMKATWVQIEGQGMNVSKTPVTDSGMKNSARGRLSVLRDGPRLRLVNEATPEQEAHSALQEVWRDGTFVVLENFRTIRERAKGGMTRELVKA
jgi:nicotinamide phosphoribosyltransferase